MTSSVNNKKKIYKYSKQIVICLELILLVSISVFFIYAIYISDDRQSLKDFISMSLLGLVWLFPISIPLAIFLLFSFFKSLSLKTLYKKIVFGFHLFNIITIPFALLFLSGIDEPTAQMMADNLKTHYDEIECLIVKVEFITNNNGGIYFEKKKDNNYEMSIFKDGKWLNHKEIEILCDQDESFTGFTQQNLFTIDKLMQSCHIQRIDKYQNDPIIYLQYEKWGYSRYVYAIYRSNDTAKKDYKEFGNDKSFIIYNDTIAFIRYGCFPGNGTFCDYKQFTN